MTSAAGDRAFPAGLRDLHPGSFAFVMATGIISIAERTYGNQLVSVLLLAVGVAGYLLLGALFALRLLRFRQEFWADTGRAQRAFGFFTFVAGSNVLAARLALGGETTWAIVLAVVGSLAWAVIVYLVPLRVVLTRLKPQPGDAVNGTWLIWVVGTQSVAIAFVGLGTMIGMPADAAALCAISIWAFGAVLYVVLMAVVTGRLLLERLDPVQATPPYWITMGATAITVLAGAELLGLDRGLSVLQSTRSAISGFTFFLWAFGTWWFPFMVLLTAWRYLRLEQPAYEQTLWSMVFPLGMYSVATDALARATRVYSLDVVARHEIWLALAAWLVAAGWMVISWLRPAWPAKSRREAAPEPVRRA